MERIVAGFGLLVFAMIYIIIFVLFEVVISFVGAAIDDAFFGMNMDEYDFRHTITGNIFVTLLIVMCYFLGALVV